MFLTCGGCGQSVPSGMASCQFCGTSLAGASHSAQATALAAQRGPGGSTRAYPQVSLETPKWVETLYYLFSGLYALSGVVDIVTAFAIKNGSGPGMAITIGLIQIILGVGMILRNDAIRSIMNFLLWISVGVNGVILFLALMAALGAGGLFFVVAIIQALRVGLSLGIIWLNNEMD